MWFLRFIDKLLFNWLHWNSHIYYRRN